MTDQHSAPVASGKTTRPKPTAAHAASAATAPADVKLLATALLEAFERLFKLGGMVLLALFIGTLLMVLPFVASTMGPQRSTGVHEGLSPTVILWTFGVGAAIVVSVLISSAVAALLKRRDVRQKLSENSEMANALQSVAMQVSEATLQLQALLLLNAQSVADMLVAATPVLKLFGAERLATDSNLNAQIIDTLEAARVIAEKARGAIAASDPRPLLGYTEELAKLTQTVVAALKQPTPGLDQLRDDLQFNVARLKQCTADLTEGVDAVSARALVYVGNVNRVGKLPLVGPFLRKRGLDAVLDDGERLESLLKAAAAANGALGKAVATGRAAEFGHAVDRVSQLRALVAALSVERQLSP